MKHTIRVDYGSCRHIRVDMVSGNSVHVRERDSFSGDCMPITREAAPKLGALIGKRVTAITFEVDDLQPDQNQGGTP